MSDCLLKLKMSYKYLLVTLTVLVIDEHSHCTRVEDMAKLGPSMQRLWAR